MSEDNQVEVEARSMGWVPKEDFRGGEDRWVDAATFVERGHTVMPILKKNNEALHGQVTLLNGRLSGLEGQLRAAQATIEAIEADKEEDIKVRVEQTRKDLLASLRAAKAAGDVDVEVALTDQLTQLGRAEDGKSTKEVKTPAQQTPQIAPEVQAWMSQNPWYGTDRRKTALMNAEAEELRVKGETSSGQVFLEKAKAGVEAILGEKKETRESKVDGGSNGARSGASTTRQTYADLPAEAKEACDKFSTRVVGPNRKHKDVASWRAAYARTYFSGETV